MSVLLTVENARRISRMSLFVKVVSNTVAVISTIIRRILLSTIKINY